MLVESLCLVAFSLQSFLNPTIRGYSSVASTPLFNDAHAVINQSSKKKSSKQSAENYQMRRYRGGILVGNRDRRKDTI
jgi:hypothetical protein